MTTGGLRDLHPPRSALLLRPHPHLPIVKFVHERPTWREPLRAGNRLARLVAHDRVAALEHRSRAGGFEAFPQGEQAVRFENEEFAARVTSAEAKEAFTAFFAKRRPVHAQ